MRFRYLVLVLALATAALATWLLVGNPDVDAQQRQIPVPPGKELPIVDLGEGETSRSDDRPSPDNRAVMANRRNQMEQRVADARLNGVGSDVAKAAVELDAQLVQAGAEANSVLLSFENPLPFEEYQALRAQVGDAWITVSFSDDPTFPMVYTTRAKEDPTAAIAAMFEAMPEEDRSKVPGFSSDRARIVGVQMPLENYLELSETKQLDERTTGHFVELRDSQDGAGVPVDMVLMEAMQ